MNTRMDAIIDNAQKLRLLSLDLVELTNHLQFWTERMSDYQIILQDNDFRSLGYDSEMQAIKTREMMHSLNTRVHSTVLLMATISEQLNTDQNSICPPSQSEKGQKP